MNLLKIPFSTKLILFGILLIAAALRFYQINWDQGYHLHPDERAIIMAVVNLQFPSSFTQFLSPDSPWNPHFFAYGSFPFYLLKYFGEGLRSVDPGFANYGLINIAGRFLSASADLITIMFIFRIGRKLKNIYTGLLAAFFYAVSVLPIQLSHFYAVDTILTCFIVITLYHLLVFYEHPTGKRATIIGIFFGLALATKISALVLLVAIGTTLSIEFFLLMRRHQHKRQLLPHLPRFFQGLLINAGIIVVVGLATFSLFEPYAIIAFPEFWQQTLYQSAMTKDAFTFPYTLQYVGKIPFLYELQNIFFFGLGPLLGALAFSGVVYGIVRLFHKEKDGSWAKTMILLSFFVTYFIIVGNFAIGFMRYMLPLYPFFALFAALLIEKIFTLFDLSPRIKIICTVYIAALLMIWPASFMQTYTNPNTRVTASEWINAMIPAGKTLAIEHWDDALPLFGSEKYQIITLELYNPDTPEKWQTISNQLAQTDYLILASNRLYTPLQKLTNCDNLPTGRCYPQTAWYYQQLFAGNLGFEKVVEFTNYPRVPFFDIPINDQGADESFTVYDHPKVMIFKKVDTQPTNIVQ